MADYAIHDTTLTGISNVIRKKDGTSALIDPADYADRINLMGMLEEKTVSGTIAHIPDGADGVPLKKCEITLPASLDGYSEVDVHHTGANLLDFTVRDHFGIKCEKTADGGAKMSGTATNTSYPVNWIPLTLPAGTYHIYISAVGTGMTIAYSKNGGYGGNLYDGDNVITLNAETEIGGYIRVSNGTVISEPETVYMQLSVAQADYEPYTAPTVSTVNLGRTIHGGTADVVNGTGTDENGNDFTFTPISPTPETALGVNNFWADEGDSSVTYRGQGTTTPILPTLVTKTITENGTYSAEDDDADGYSEVTVDVESIVKIGINSGKLNIANGTITADSAWCYTDTFDCPSGNITMDFGESGLNVGIELVNASDNSHANYWSCGNDLRYREVDISSYYSPTKKARLSFKKANLSKVLLMDFGNGKIYSSLNASQFEEPQVSLLSMNNAQSEESEVSENE